MAKKFISDEDIVKQYDAFVKASTAPMLNPDLLPVEEPKVELPIQQPVPQSTRQPAQQIQQQVQEPVQSEPVQPSSGTEQVKQPNELDSLINDYKKALSESEKSMQLDKDQLKSAQWADTINSLARNINAFSGVDAPAPEQTNFAKQYLDQVAAQRAGATSSLESRAKLLDLYRRLQPKKEQPGSGITPYQQALLDLQKRRLDIDEKNKKSTLDTKQAKESVKLNESEAAMARSLGTKIGSKVSIANQLEAVLNNSKKLSPDDKLMQYRQLIKTLNSTEGQDAVGVQEAERLASKLDFAMGNFTNNNPIQFGRDIKGFEKQIEETIKGIKKAVEANQKVLDDMYNKKQGNNKESGVKKEESQNKTGNTFPMKVRRTLPNGKTQVATVSNEAELNSAREKGFN